MSENFLVHIDKAKREIAAADSLVKVKDLWNKADAMRALGQAAKDPELVNSATEFKLRCERRLGEMLNGMKESGEITHAHKGENSPNGAIRTKLSDLNIDYNLSARAQRIASVPEERFEAAIVTARQEEQQITRKAIRSLIGDATEQNTIDVSELPTGKFRTIVIDPPWPLQMLGRDARPSQVTKEYLSMPIEEIAKLPIADLAEPTGCHVYLWFTQKWRRVVFELFDAWGVKDECFLTWVKNVGFTPYSWMYSTEHVLFGRIGSLPLEQMGKRLDFAAKVREHSRKPDEFYDLIRQVSPEPRLDFFSREKRDGFEQYGNETEKFGKISV